MGGDDFNCPIQVGSGSGLCADELAVAYARMAVIEKDHAVMGE